ncbi:aspartate dehydrogenase [Providencia rettgeri]|uniref:aspartate dehydrogenase n=1 Tax=Providencia TaxID=586 RepID=UPI00065DE3CD|nr:MULTISPECIES: aspartate dehydrogenase [Providencia]ELR5132837.1 aspartate dehydrogenase [Providencia rettgeri]ELR5176845.1 aspartate dehydrogenase [Providencia rettgeri]ELR5260847.1 aspartate dehydrogenase [Providencia rettgeri]MDK3007616.1 aspartate dehydrogenase [Providencia rettgeri]HEM6889169.1 aspartate dehydrogenase [Providencia rettgeri]
MKTLMLIGYGAMAQEVIARLPSGITLRWVVARPHHHNAIQERFKGAVLPIDSLDDFNEHPDLVLECAGHQAVQQYAPTILQRGWTLAIISTGVLADATFENTLTTLAKRHQSQLIPLSGAVAGLDGLRAAKEANITHVIYQSRKSPTSWRNGAAERYIDLSSVSEATAFFSGSAREAALNFPANANVAATVALYGIGMDATQVQLIVDPDTTKNSHQIDVRGDFGHFSIELNGNPLPSNPKTSMLAALSAVEICRRIAEQQVS